MICRKLGAVHMRHHTVYRYPDVAAGKALHRSLNQRVGPGDELIVCRIGYLHGAGHNDRDHGSGCGGTHGICRRDGIGGCSIGRYCGKTVAPNRIIAGVDDTTAAKNLHLILNSLRCGTFQAGFR